MLEKWINLVVVLFLFICCISCVNASDNITDSNLGFGNNLSELTNIETYEKVVPLTRTFQSTLL